MIATIADYPTRVFDATGTEIKWAVWANVETGECLVQVRDVDGNPVFDELETKILKRRVTYPAPLKLKKVEL